MEQGELGVDVVVDELAQLERELAEGRAPPRARQRVVKLRRDRERALLASVLKVLCDYELRGDALVRAVVRRCPALLECAADPLWRTVEVLEFRGELRGFQLGAFLNQMPALRELGLGFTELPEVPVPQVEALTINRCAPQVGARFPGLRRLEARSVSEPRPFWDFVRARQLASVTVGSLTWEGEVLRANDSWIEEPLLELMWLGPKIKRLIIPEDHLFGDDSGWRLGQLFARARAMGADVVLEPAPPGGSRRSRREPSDWWT